MAEQTLPHNEACQHPGHTKHLCFLMHDGFHYSQKEQYKAMVQNARFRCQNCARTAANAENLCAPVEL